MAGKKILIDRNLDNINKTRHLSNKKTLWHGLFKDLDSVESVLEKGLEIIKKSKKNTSRISISALRLLMKEKTDEITSDKFAYIDIDKKFLHEIKGEKVELQGDWPRKKRVAETDIRGIQDEEDEKNAKEQPIDDTVDTDDNVEKMDSTTDIQESKDTELPGDVNDVEGGSDTMEIDDSTQQEESNKEEKDAPVLEDIKTTHPDDIPEQTTPVVQDQIQQIEVEDKDTLPSGAIPQGSDSADIEIPLVDPNTLATDTTNVDGGVDDLDDLPSYSDIESDEDELDHPILSSEGFDNQENPIIITHIPSSVEIQSMIIDALVNETRPYMESDKQAKEFVMEMLGGHLDDESVVDIQQDTLDIKQPPIEDGPRQNSADNELQSQTKDEKEVDVEDPPSPMQVVDSEKQDDTVVDSTDIDNTDNTPVQDDVIMAEPSKKQLREQRSNLKKSKLIEKQMEKNRVKQSRQQNAIDSLHAEIFQTKSPIITDKDESEMLANRTKDVVVRDYIAKIALKHIDSIQREKTSIVGQIRSGHVKSAWSLHTSDTPTANKMVSDSINDQDIKERLRRAINSNYLARSSDILAEVADYTSRNAERIQRGLDPSNAISKYIYPSFRDPDTFNIVKYRSDADGNVVINKGTGQPIIESISATSRDDGKKLLDQKLAVDATDTPSPYYPIYGKQARRFFSKHEFNYLGRLFQGAGGAARGSIPKPLDIKGEIGKMLSEMSSSLEITDKSILGEKSFRQWSELSILQSSFHRYNQTADYQYIQDKKELQQDGTMVDPEAVESAAKLLQNITVQKLLDLMSDQRSRQSEVLNQKNPKTNVGDLTDKQQTAELGEFDMDITKEPKSVGAEIPTDSSESTAEEGVPTDGGEQKDDKQTVNLNNWVSTQPSFQPPKKQMYRFADNLAPFGGDLDTLTDL